MSRWHDMAVEERLEAVRLGYVQGRSTARIGAALGVTKNAVLGLAWRYCLTPANAHLWTKEGYAAKRAARLAKIAETAPYKPSRSNKMSKAERDAMLLARRHNRGKDEKTREAVAKLNSIPHPTDVIAEAMGVSDTSVVNWRMGRRSMSAFSLSLVDETVARLS